MHVDINALICSRERKGRKPANDINAMLSGHVETVVLMSRAEKWKVHALSKRRKGKKMVVITLIIPLVLWITISLVDYFRVKSFQKPIFSVPVQTADDGGSGKYQGLGYSFVIKGNFMPEDELPGVTYYEYFIFGNMVTCGTRD